MFTREDWTLLRTLSGVAQTAGAPVHRLRRVVLKELVDNAYDAAEAVSGARVRVDVDDDDGTMFVHDTGPGIAGTPEHIAALFSIRRPLTSSKLLRLPTRGALGNGLRVVAGAVLTSGGSLVVTTGGQRITLRPEDDGSTAVAAIEPCDQPGTAICVRLGPAIPDECLQPWIYALQRLGRAGIGYRGKTSPHWYTPADFWELLQAAGDASVRDVLEAFDGLAGTTARSALLRTADLTGRSAVSLSRREAEHLLTLARQQVKPVKAERLGRAGNDGVPFMAYGYADGVLHLDDAHIPYRVEAWAGRKERAPDSATLYVNRSPTLVDLAAYRGQSSRMDIGVFGAQLRHAITVGQAPVDVVLNVTTPYMPITSQGKEPDLTEFAASIITATVKATRRTKGQRVHSISQRVSKKDAVLAVLETAIEHASGGGRYRYSTRQLFYAVRPLVAGRIDGDLNWDWFCKIIGEYEDDQIRTDLPGSYRDNRGTLYHPHTGEDIPIGTLTVEGYQRPEWVFNKILYCEKEGFFPLLQADRWPERHDCALLTSKGYASRAARDVIDLLGKSEEPITFYCIHDADADGTMIYQSLLQATRARPGRNVHIVNLGLDPEEAVAMGLEVETVAREKREAPIATYIKAPWRSWLQGHRVELNAMSSPQFITWLDAKMASLGTGKVIPPEDVLDAHVRQIAEAQARAYLTARILRDADLDGQVAALLDQQEAVIAADIEQAPAIIAAAFAEQPTHTWADPLHSRWAQRLPVER